MAKLLSDALSNPDFNVADLENRLSLLGYKNIKRESSKTVSIITDENRVQVLENVERNLQDLNAFYDKNKGPSSIGAVITDRFTIRAKPASKQGRRAPGIENEFIMINGIKQYVDKGAIHVRITDGIKSKLYKDIVDVQEVGRDTSGRKKADVNLIDKRGNKIPISIKKDNAEFWESADSYWSLNAKKIIDRLEAKKEIKIESFRNVFKIKPTVAVKADDQEKRNVVFGNDIQVNKGIVLVKTFGSNDFTLSRDSDELVIKVTKIIDSISDLNGNNDIYFLIRNDSSRTGSKIRPGLRVQAVSASRINRNVKVVTK